MELEFLETLPNGRKIYFRPKANRSVVKQAAIDISTKWQGSGKDLKPLFQDQAGKLWEIESGGKTFKTAANPEGYRFGNYVKHLHRNLNRRGKFKAATVLLSEVEEATRQVFPGLSKKDNKLFAKKLFDLNEQEIGRIIASRKVTESTDHVRSLAKGGLNWFTNLVNIETPINLTKGAKDLPDASFKDINNPANRIETIKASLFSDVIKGNPKYKAQVIADAFGPNTVTRKVINNTLKGVGAAGTTLLKTTAEVVADPLTTYTGTVEALNQQKSLTERVVGGVKATEGMTGIAGWFSPAIRPISIHLGAAVSYAELSDTTGLKEKAEDKFQRDVVTGTSTFGFGRNPFEGIFRKETLHKYTE